MDHDSVSEAERGVTLGELAELTGGRLEGSADLRVAGIVPVDEAGPDQMAFLSSSKYTRYVEESRAGAYLVSTELESFVPVDKPRVVVDRPYPALRTLLGRFHPPRPAPEGVHPTAILGRGVELGAEVRVEAYAVLGDGVVVGDRARIGAHCVVGRDSIVGADTRLHPHVVLYDETVVGARVTIHSGARLGADGFGYTFLDGAQRKMPQVGRCVIGDDVEIGANTTVDRGSLGDTVVGDGVKIDNLVQVAHNVRIGDHSLLAALVGISGSTRVGERVWMGGQVGVSNHLHIGDGARLAIASKLMKDVPDGETMSGHPARRHRDQLRDQAHARRIPKLVARIEALESALEALRSAAPAADDEE